MGMCMDLTLLGIFTTSAQVMKDKKCFKNHENRYQFGSVAKDLQDKKFNLSKPFYNAEL